MDSNDSNLFLVHSSFLSILLDMCNCTHHKCQYSFLHEDKVLAVCTHQHFPWSKEENKRKYIDCTETWLLKLCTLAVTSFITYHGSLLLKKNIAFMTSSFNLISKYLNQQLTLLGITNLTTN